MKKVIRYLTNDGKTHETKDAAIRHLDNCFGDIVIKLAHEMAHLNKHGDFISFIENSLGRFYEAYELDKEINEKEPEENEEN